MNQEKKRVLFVDDEENNLNAFRAYFRKKYEVYTADNAEDGMRIAERIPMQVLISDQRMPRTSGVDFLEQSIRVSPDSIRLLITGQSDLETVIEAINRGGISQYIQKPWDFDRLSIILDNSMQLYDSRRELRLKNELLQKANDELNRFVYSVSHDLRSPLMSMLGLIDLSRMQDDEQKAKEYLALIEQSVHRLDHYVRNIIEYFQNARAAERTEPINFRDLIEDVIDSLKHMDSSVNCSAEVQENGVFCGDAFRLRIVLGNLVSNAIKYKNPQSNRPEVHIHVKSGGEGALIRISDNGIGILREHVNHIFRMFFRADSVKSKEGNGLGLYIVKEALDKMGGSIEVESKAGEGTAFTIFVPNKPQVG